VKEAVNKKPQHWIAFTNNVLYQCTQQNAPIKLQ